MNNIVEFPKRESFEVYPNSQESLYFVEFSRWPGKALEYRLFKKNSILSEKQLEKELLDCENENEKNWMRMQNEGHPYQLLSGIVNEHPGVISFETVDFLKFTVDSLNNMTEAQKV